MFFKRELELVWEQLRAKKVQLPNYLESIYINGIRGIKELRIGFPFPVSVLAGPNGCGKSTILFALACAYDVAGAGPKDFKPSKMFPDFRCNDNKIPSDRREDIEIVYTYIDDNKHVPMVWRRGKGKRSGWNKSFQGRRRQKQPSRDVYIRTLTDLRNPAEAKGFAQLYRKELSTEDIDVSLIEIAQNLLPHRYSKIKNIKHSDKELLFAMLKDKSSSEYSEFHMSAGERAILRLSIEISKLRNALILIDEIEASLHPHVQKNLMLELQRLALRNSHQIIVATHSISILNTVPSDARIFLERTGETVIVHTPYRDIVQKSLYGDTVDKLSLYCEDKGAENILTGFLSSIISDSNLEYSDLEIGHDTGKDEFKHHIRTISRVGLLDNYIFVLDGDAREQQKEFSLLESKLGRKINILYLPDNNSPEEWIWNILNTNPELYCSSIGINSVDLQNYIKEIDRLYATSTSKAADIAKVKIKNLASKLMRTEDELMKSIAKQAIDVKSGEAKIFINKLREMITDWRSRTLV